MVWADGAEVSRSGGSSAVVGGACGDPAVFFAFADRFRGGVFDNASREAYGWRKCLIWREVVA